MRRPASRSGAGAVLVTGMCFLAVMGVMALAQSMLATQVTDLASRATLGRMALQVAESALEEARAVVARRANTAGDPLFIALRRMGREGTSVTLPTVSLAAADLPGLTQLLSMSELSSFELAGPVEVTFHDPSPLVGVPPSDFALIAQMKVKVGTKLDRSIHRSITETAAVRVSLLTLPPALGAVPLVVASGTSAAGGPGAGADVNAIAAEILDRHTPDIRAKHDDILARLSDPRATSVAFIQQIRPFYEAIGGARGGTDHIARVEVYRTLLDPNPPFHPPASTLQVANRPEVALEDVDLQTRLVPLARRLQTQLADLAAKSAAVDRSLSSRDTSAGAVALHRDNAKLMTDHVLLLREMLGAVKKYQIAITQVRAGQQGPEGDVHARLKADLALVDALPVCGEDPNLWRERATWRLDEDPPDLEDRKPAADRLVELLARLDPGRTGVSGIVYVDNPSEPVTLSGERPGRWVICVRGGCVIDGLKAVGDDGVITVVACGEGGSIVVRGDVRASLVLTGAALSIESSAAIQGTVVLDDLPPSSTGGLAGRVTADPRLAASDGDAFWSVSVSPWLRTRVVERK